jgi:hypothetical protein
MQTTNKTVCTPAELRHMVECDIQKVWKAFNMKTFRDYHDLYNTADVLQLADVFQKFRNSFIKAHKLDPLRYYIDANNLYGWAMSQLMPTGGFKWMDDDEPKNWRDIPCVLEVDLEYPEVLHDLLNEYPLAPERVVVNKVEKLDS